eukprot:385323-Rhodomonas_salina.1
MREGSCARWTSRGDAEMRRCGDAEMLRWCAAGAGRAHCGGDGGDGEVAAGGADSAAGRAPPPVGSPR